MKSSAADQAGAKAHETELRANWRRLRTLPRATRPLRPYASSAHDLRRDTRGSDMKRKGSISSDDLHPEYTSTIRRRFVENIIGLIREGTNVVVFDPDVAKAFPIRQQ